MYNPMHNPCTTKSIRVDAVSAARRRQALEGEEGDGAEEGLGEHGLPEVAAEGRGPDRGDHALGGERGVALGGGEGGGVGEGARRHLPEERHRVVAGTARVGEVEREVLGGAADLGGAGAEAGGGEGGVERTRAGGEGGQPVARVGRAGAEAGRRRW